MKHTCPVPSKRAHWPPCYSSSLPDRLASQSFGSCCVLQLKSFSHYPHDHLTHLLSLVIVPTSFYWRTSLSLIFLHNIYCQLTSYHIFIHLLIFYLSLSSMGQRLFCSLFHIQLFNQQVYTVTVIKFMIQFIKTPNCAYFPANFLTSQLPLLSPLLALLTPPSW